MIVNFEYTNIGFHARAVPLKDARGGEPLHIRDINSRIRDCVYAPFRTLESELY